MLSRVIAVALLPILMPIMRSSIILVLIPEDGMAYVFDYDPLVLEIDRLATDCHYETQERLISRIVQACSVYSEITSLEISLRKSPVHNGSGSLGVRLQIDEATLNHLRASNS